MNEKHNAVGIPYLKCCTTQKLTGLLRNVESMLFSEVAVKEIKIQS